MQLPNLFIVGAPKCGTTSMAYYLSQHPQVFVSKFKEPHYFNLDSPNRFTFTREQYLKYFEDADSSYKYLTEASVWYLYSKCAIDEILKFNSDSKFIVMVRNPVDMYKSLHSQLLFSGNENQKSPLKAWELQENRRNKKDIPFACRDASLLQYEEVCKLGAQIERMLEKVSKEKVFFIVFDDLKKDPKKVYSDLQSFLGIENHSLEEFPVVNEKKEKRWPWLSNLFVFINRIKRKLKIRKGLGIANYIIKKNKKAATDTFREEFELMKPQLKKVFAEDVEKIRRITGKELKNW